ncbi:MAG: VOC family protein [Gammaproteobacteria bacterium]|nr:VOC family protein [Gammaproteobacteria bacterium]
MSDTNQVGRVGWIDITVDDASGMRDFYSKVVGWSAESVSMGDYDDFSMAMPATGEAVTGICHARGSNADLPSGWLIYIVVADLDASIAACTEKGGRIMVEPRSLAGGRFCVIEDPSGASAALFQP